MIPELTKGKRGVGGRQCQGAGQEGVHPGVQLVGWQGGRWGKVLGFEEQHTHRGSTVLCCHSGSWRVWEGVKRSQRGSCGNHGGSEKPLSPFFKLLTAQQGGGSPGPGSLPHSLHCAGSSQELRALFVRAKRIFPLLPGQKLVLSGALHPVFSEV